MSLLKYRDNNKFRENWNNIFGDKNTKEENIIPKKIKGRLGCQPLDNRKTYK